MTTPNSHVSQPNDRELVIERLFHAPRELVFEAFSKCEHLTHWWGVQGWTLPVCKLDFRPGGEWLYCMRGPGGEESWGKALYHEIVQPERIVYTDYFVDQDGNPNPAMPAPRITLTFNDVAGKTKLLNHAVYPSPDDLNAILSMGVIEGIGETFDRLESLLTELSR